VGDISSYCTERLHSKDRGGFFLINDATFDIGTQQLTSEVHLCKSDFKDTIMNNEDVLALPGQAKAVVTC